MAAKVIPSRGLVPFSRLLQTYSSHFSYKSRPSIPRPFLVDSIARISGSCAMRKDPNTPKKSGDRGPGKNFNKKMAKQANMKFGWGNSGMQLESLLEGMKIVDVEGGKGADLSSLLDVETEDETTGVRVKESEVAPTLFEKASSEESSSEGAADLMGLLSEMKIISQPKKSKSEGGGRGDGGNCQFLDPTAGPRLGIFDHPKPEVEVMPQGKPTYTELEEQKKLQALLLLKPWCYYDDLLEGKGVPYPRKFPIDNENYDQGEEARVGFEDHVLLDHLLDDFPEKGPVRHFMELVVTGLSKNPYYTAAEKKEIVVWYKDYFKDFSLEELQSLQQQTA